VVQLSVKEALIAPGTKSGKTDKDLEANELKQIFERCGVIITERKPCKEIGTQEPPKRLTRSQQRFQQRTYRMTS